MYVLMLFRISVSIIQLPSIGATFQSIDDIVSGFNSSDLSPINLLVLVSLLESLSVEDVVNSSQVWIMIIYPLIILMFLFYTFTS